MEDRFSAARNRMIEKHIIDRGIKDDRIIRVMREIPRHRFIKKEYLDIAYSDHPLPIGYGQTISQPYIVALMVSMLELEEDDVVLEIGGGCGYQTAILAKMAKSIYSMEIVPELAEEARNTLLDLQITNASIMTGDGSDGFIGGGPFQAIIFSAAAPRITYSLLNQLSDGGVLVAPVGERSHQRLLKWIRDGNDFIMEEGILVSFVPLKGKHGWA